VEWGVGRCVLRGEGIEPFLFNWINIVIHILSIDISIDIPCPVATLGWQFATWVWRPLSRPPPALCVGTLYARTPAFQHSWKEKLPDERRRCRPKALVVKQGLHPHPGPTIYDCGFDDSDGGGWASDDHDLSDIADDGERRANHTEGHSVYDDMLLNPSVD